MEAISQNPRIRFGAFEVLLRSGELHKFGIRIKLQDQPFQVLVILLEHHGELVTREELQQKLWPADTFVDFDTSLNSAIKKLRDALADSAEEPRYIETVPRRGYRFIAQVEGTPKPTLAVMEKPLAQVASAVPAPGFWNSRRSLVAAGAAALVVIVALASWRIFFARPVLTGTDVILLASFTNKTGDPIFDNSLDKALQIKLTESPFLSVLPEGSVRETLRTMRRDPNEPLTRDVGIEICKRQGLKAVVVPEIAAVGSNYLVTLEAIDARSQKPIARAQMQADSKDQVIAALGKAGSQLRKQLGESLGSLEQHDAPLDLATTSSLEALQAYRTGLAPLRSGKSQEAIPFFQRAIELDPQFCSAYVMLGSAYHGTGDDQASRKNYARAFELKDGRLTQEENFLATATYYWNITGNLEKENAVLVLYQQAYPRSVAAANLLGINYSILGRNEEALQQFRWVLEHSPVPSAFYYSNAAQASMSLDRLDDAKQVLDEWRQKGTLFPYQVDMRYRIAFFEKDTATLERLAPENPADDVSWQQLQMQLAFYRGDLKKYRALSDSLVNLQRNDKQPENVADELAARGQLESFLGNYAPARSFCRRAVETGSDSITELWRCGEALAAAGEAAQAEAMAAKLERLNPENTIEQKVHVPLIRSIIERERGNLAKAADLLAQAEPYHYTLDIPYQRGLAYLAAAEPAKAAAEFEKLIVHRGSNWWVVYAPLTQLGMARAYAMQGDRDKSRKAYDEFFTTWKNADPKIPLLGQAKTEYKKLSSASASNSAAPRR
jgi:DNA-binding winged helix-turn-helix (wHTH) protein/Tfp pilus assembly protein PilF